MPEITFPRSDGLKKNWPEGWVDGVLDIQTNPNYNERVGRSHQKYKLFMQKIGAHIAETKGLSNPDSYVLSEFPDGYCLFFHHKLQASGADRSDIYLYGSRHVLKFRSPAEFFAHADFLMDETRDINTHKVCTCKYSSNAAPPTTDLSERKRKLASSGAGGSGGTPAPKKAKGAGGAESKAEQYRKEMAQTTEERNRDLRTGKLYRTGEVIWVKIPSIIRPAEFSPTPSLPQIDYWPGVIVSSTVSVHTDLSSNNIHHSTKYDLKLSGHIDPNTQNGGPAGQTMTFEEVDILPWAAIDSASVWTTIQDDMLQVAEQFNKAQKSTPTSTTNTDTAEERRVKVWRKKYARGMELAEVGGQGNWDQAVIRFGESVLFSIEASRYWTQTDGYPVVEDGGEERAELPEGVREEQTYFQGLWWGPERIWLYDLVRLKKTRGSLPTNGLKAPSPGSEERGVFVRVGSICVKVTKTENQPSRYLCIIHGDIYELADAAWVKENEPEETTAPTNENGGPAWATAEDTKDDGDMPAPLPKAPDGLVFRKLNPTDCEVTIDIFDVAGRAYPRLGEIPYIGDILSGTGEISNETSATVTAIDIEKLKSLVGTKTGAIALTTYQPWQWLEGRFNAVVAAGKAAFGFLAETFQADSVKKTPAANGTNGETSTAAGTGNEETLLASAAQATMPAISAAGLDADKDVFMA